MRNLGSGLLLVLAFCGSLPKAAIAQSLHLAPGFTALPKGAKVAVMPVDIELFLVTAGGVPEPKADWTETANQYVRAILKKRNAARGLTSVEVSEQDTEQFVELNALHGAVSRAIALHHFGGPGSLSRLVSKDDKLDWSLGSAVQGVKSATGADYALFTWLRDGTTSAGRAAVMLVFGVLAAGNAAAASAGPRGGGQTGYASLVDLNTGRVVWFNRLQRGTGSLLDENQAAETVDALLTGFPVAK